MLLINLLPWREQLEYKIRRSIIIVFILCFAITLYLLFAYHFSLLARNSQQLKINSYYNQQLKVLDQSILKINKIKQQKQVLLDQMLWIHKIQLNNNKIPLLFSEIAKIMPREIVLTTFEYLDQGKIILHGYATVNTSISLLLKNIDNSLKFVNANLVKSQTNEHDKQFEIIFKLKG